MKKRILYSTLILAIVIVPFRLAYLEQSHNNMLNLISFLIVTACFMAFIAVNFYVGDSEGSQH